MDVTSVALLVIYLVFCIEISVVPLTPLSKRLLPIISKLHDYTVTVVIFRAKYYFHNDDPVFFNYNCNYSKQI